MAQKEKTLVQVLINGILAIFLPIVNLLSAAGILKGILAILTATAVLSTKSETYIVLNAMGDSLFYFLPVMLAYTSANKFGVNPFTAVVISGILLYPDLTQLMEKGNTVHFLGLGLRGVTLPFKRDSDHYGNRIFISCGKSIGKSDSRTDQRIYDTANFNHRCWFCDTCCVWINWCSDSADGDLWIPLELYFDRYE